jgi:hypothetical protein
MRTIFIPLIVILVGITELHAQVSDSSKRTQSRRPTINQSQAKPSQKELREIELNRNRDKGRQVDTTTTTGINSRKQPTENRALKNESNQAQDDNNPKSPANTNEVSIFETGTSSAGSPSTISDDDGKGRDGTNNVQRSTPNMAGSPPPRRGSMKASNASATSGSDRATKESKDKEKADVKSDKESSKEKAKSKKEDDKKKSDKKQDKSKSKDKSSKDDKDQRK